MAQASPRRSASNGQIGKSPPEEIRAGFFLPQKGNEASSRFFKKAAQKILRLWPVALEWHRPPAFVTSREPCEKCSGPINPIVLATKHANIVHHRPHRN